MLLHGILVGAWDGLLDTYERSTFKDLFRSMSYCDSRKRKKKLKEMLSV